MNPEVASAIGDLERRGILSGEKAARFGRVARADLVSIRTELRLLLYVGVVVFMSGTGLFVKDTEVGPAAIVVALSAAAGLSLFFVFRRAAPFSWEAARDPHLGLDYVLLLGTLLVGADLAYLETTFSILGAAWPWHLLIVSAVATALSVRFDSTVVFGFGLSTFAAWRGVSTSLRSPAWVFGDSEAAVRANALGCGILFALGGELLSRGERKRHFGTVADTLGWILILASLAWRQGSDADPWRAALLGVGVGLAVLAFRRRRFWLFALGVLGAYVGLSSLLLFSAHSDALTFGWFIASPLFVLALLFVADRQLRKVP